MVSEQFLKLVAGLEPSREPIRPGELPGAARNRFVLFALAYLADGEGRCVASHGTLAGLTWCSPLMVRAALVELREERLLRSERDGRGPSRHQLVRAELERRQHRKMLLDEASIYELECYGLETRAFNALRREGIHDVEVLGSWVAEYRALPAQRRNGFHAHLNARNLGVKTGQKILDAYDRWMADRAGDVG